MDVLKTIGKRISSQRKEMGLSQEKLAELSGLHRNYIGSIERAEKNATITVLKKISDALNISLAKLFHDL